MIRKKIYTGSCKTLYQLDSEDFSLIMSFNDNIKLLNGKILNISGKGAINNNISSFIMTKLDMVGIDNHFIEKMNMREQLIHYVDVFPIQISISTLACGRYVTDFGMEEGYVLDQPIIDFNVKNRELKFPIINEHQIINFGWLNKYEIKELKHKATRICDFLTGLFAGIGLRLVETRLEFGRVFGGEDFIVMLSDEISPDNCRLWDINTNEKYGFELLESDPEKAIKSYNMIMERFGIVG